MDKSKSIEDIPIELWKDIIKYIDIRSLSKLICTNKFFYNRIHFDKWYYIDNLLDSVYGTCLIPNTKETFLNYRYIITWTDIILSRNGKHDIIIPEHVLSWIEDKRDLEIISVYQKFSENLIRKLFDKIDYRNLLTNQSLPIDLLERIIKSQYTGQVEFILQSNDWYNIWSKQKINFNFVQQYINHIQWQPISCNKSVVSFELIDAYSEHLIWQEITKHGINEFIIEKYLHKMDIICWANVAQFTKLSSRFIKQYKTNLNFYLNILLRYQILDEDYLLELISSFDDFDYEIYFESIALNQKISYQFILSYQEHLSLKSMIRNKHILREDLAKIYF